MLQEELNLDNTVNEQDPPVTQTPPGQDPPGDEEEILIDPILSGNKIKSYIDNFKSKGGKWVGSDDVNYYVRSFDNFVNDLQFSQANSFIKIQSEDEISDLYDTFRDTEAEEIEREKLRSLYIMNELNENQIKATGLDSNEIVDDADATVYLKPKKRYKVQDNVEEVKETIKSFQTGDKFDTQIAVRTLESRNQLRSPVYDYTYLDYSENDLKLYNDNDIWQNQFRKRRHEALKNQPGYNFSYDIDGTFGQMIESLDFSFILQDAAMAAELFNQKFNSYGIKAVPQSDKDTPISRSRESIKIYGVDGALLMEQRVFGSQIAGLDKEQLLEIIGTKDISDPGGLLKTIIRPQVYTQEYGNFITAFKEAVRNNSPASEFANGFNIISDDLTYTYIQREFDAMSDIGIMSADVIVNIMQELDMDVTVDDIYRNYSGFINPEYSKTNKRLFDIERTSAFLQLAFKTLRETPEGQGQIIELTDPNINLDKDGILGGLQYEYDLGVNTSTGLQYILGHSTDINDIIVDRYGNQESVRSILEKSLSTYSMMVRRNQNNTSRTIGHGLKINDGYKRIPIDGVEGQLMYSLLTQKGYNYFQHHPTDGILIDGKASTYEQIFNIITDPSMNNKVRLGEIKIDIAPNPEDYGVMEAPIRAVASLMERNNSNFEGILGYRNAFTNTTDQTYEWFEDLFQSIGIEFINIGASIKEILADTTKGLGVPSIAVDLAFGKYGAIPGMPSTYFGSYLDMKNVEQMREEYLPLWTTSITEAQGDDFWRGAGEFFMLANQPLGQSLPYMGAIMINPWFGVSTIGITAYGESIYDYKGARESLQKAYDAGVPLTEVELNQMDMSDGDIRLYAGTNGLIEAAFTAAFTARYLHGSKWLRKVIKGKNAPSAQVIDDIAKQMEFRFSKGYNASFNRLMGIEGKALVYENIEENNITFFKYLVESGFGIREFDYGELGKLMKETTYHASFSSLGLSGIMRYQTNKNFKKTADLVMEENLGTSELYRQLDLKFQIQDALQKYINNETFNNKTPKEQIEKSEFYKWATDFISKTSANIKEITDSRKRLIEAIPAEDKIRFMTILADIERKQLNAADDKANSVVRITALNDIAILKKELSEIVSMTGNPDAFNFLSFDDQSRYLSQAFSEINFDELKEENPEITPMEWQEKVKERAVEIYVSEVKEKIKNNQTNNKVPVVDPANLAPSFGNIDVVSIISDDIDVEFRNKFDLVEQLENATNKLINSYGPTITVAKGEDGGVQSELKADGTVIETDESGNKTVRKPAETETNQQDDTELTPEQKEINRVGELRTKVENIIERIKSYQSSQNNEFIQSLDLNAKTFQDIDGTLNFSAFIQGNHILKFFETLDGATNFSDLKMEDFAFQRIESILDAHDIAVDISTNIQDGTLQPFKGGKFMNKLLKFYAGKYNLSMKESIATLDVLKNLVIRNKNHAAPFLSLFEEINRKIAVIDGKQNLDYSALLNQYVAEVNNSRKKGNILDYVPNFFVQTKDKKKKRTVDINDDYQMAILSGLGRINLDLIEDGQGETNSEFFRYKKNVLYELEHRRRESIGEISNPNYTKQELKTRYELLLKAVNDLDLKNAQNYEDVVSKARPYNVKIVDYLRSEFKLGEDKAKDRVYGFGQKWTNFDNYMPIFTTPNGAKLTARQLFDLQFQDSSAMNLGEGVTISTTGALQYSTTPENYLKTEYRLQFGGFLRNASGALKGSQIDAEVRQDMVTLVNLFNSPIFQKLFENEQDYMLLRELFATKFNQQFNKKVNEGRNPYTDYGDVKNLKFNFDEGYLTGVNKNMNSIQEYATQFMNTTFGLGSAYSLASLTQPVQQYYSALTNHYFRAESLPVRNYIIGKMGQFTVGMASTANGTKVNTVVGEYIQNTFGQGDKSNIYKNSQVNLRNSLRAELPLGNNAELDITYYEDAFRIKKGFFEGYGLKSGKYTFDQVINFLNSNSEAALNFFLARTDKVAANAAFEAHYLDFKIRNGSKYPSDSKGRMEWWKRENENPDTDAINYADAIVKEVMRPSDMMTEAGIYADNNKVVGRVLMQMFYPFQKFSMNARTQFWTQYSLANDESLPPEQRAEARRAMQGIAGEMAVFQASKTITQATIYGTLGSVLLGFDEDEIERYGGLQALMGEWILPIDDRNYMKKIEKIFNEEFNGDINALTSIEGLNALYEMEINHRVGEGFYQNFRDLQIYGNTYGNKTDMSPKNNNVFQMIVGDLIKTLSPAPAPDAAYTYLFAFANHHLQESNLIDDKLFLEFASEDFGKDNFTAEFLSENLGLIGVSVQQTKKVIEAFELMTQNKISKSTPSGAMQTQYVGTGNEAINQKLDDAIAFIFYTRLITALNIGTGGRVPVPYAELEKINTRLFRGMERYVNQTQSREGDDPQAEPDDKMRTGLLRHFYTLEEQRQERESGIDSPLEDTNLNLNQ